mmetsp:Transcript_259/g.579  ORF Transcript_259/g.579 Transcript_259/m.579 type:complete len:242 (-) Transcript_259:137-862(-)
MSTSTSPHKKHSPAIDLSSISNLTGSATFNASSSACPLTTGGDGNLIHSSGDLSQPDAGSVHEDASRMYRMVALAKQIMAAEDAASPHRGKELTTLPANDGTATTTTKNGLRRITVNFPPAPITAGKAAVDTSGGTVSSAKSSSLDISSDAAFSATEGSSGNGCTPPTLSSGGYVQYAATVASDERVYVVKTFSSTTGLGGGRTLAEDISGTPVSSASASGEISSEPAGGKGGDATVSRSS